MVAILSLLTFLTLGAPSRPNGVKLSGWIVFYDNGESVASFKAHASQLQSVSAEWIRCTNDGKVVRPDQPSADQRAQILDIAKQHKVKVYALAANAGFKPDGFEAAMATPETMKEHIDAMVKIAADDGVDGIDLDYESLNAKDRSLFSTFVQALADALHSKKLALVLAVHAKTSEPGDWDGAQAQDLAALGKAADMIRVMTYDFHWETSNAGPIAPPDWVERVMKFAQTEVPARKLDVGVAAYGYSWLGKKADSLTWTDWTALTKAHRGATRDPFSEEMTLTYDGRTVYFSDSGAMSAKREIVQKYGFHGMAVWRLGSEDPDFWNMFLMQTRK